jgi:hypothetical protein
LATPTTNPIFPASNDIVVLIEKPDARQVKGNVAGCSIYRPHISRGLKDDRGQWRQKIQEGPGQASFALKRVDREAVYCSNEQHDRTEPTTDSGAGFHRLGIGLGAAFLKP